MNIEYMNTVFRIKEEKIELIWIAIFILFVIVSL